MPFAFTWTNVDPADPTAANLLGKDIRDLRAAIQERMDSVFCDPVGSWANSDPTHPLVVAPSVLGSSANKVITLHHSQFKYAVGTAALTSTDLYVQNVNQGTFVGSSPATLMAGVVLPVGVTITSASILVDPRNAGSVPAALEWYTYSALGPVITNITNIASAGSPGITVAAQGGLGFGVNFGMAIIFKVTLNDSGGGSTDGNRLYAAEVFYSTPDCRSTY